MTDLVSKRLILAEGIELLPGHMTDGGIMPPGHGAMTTLAVAILAPALLASLWGARRA